MPGCDRLLSPCRDHKEEGVFRDVVREVLFDREMSPWRDHWASPTVVTEAPEDGFSPCEGGGVGRTLGVSATAFFCLDTGDTSLVPLGREGEGRGPDHSVETGVATAGEDCDPAGNRVISTTVPSGPLEAAQKVT